MTKLTIISSKNGWLVIEGKCEKTDWIEDHFPGASTFNSLDKAISHIRKVIKVWHQPTQDKPL